MDLEASSLTSPASEIWGIGISSYLYIFSDGSPKGPLLANRLMATSRPPKFHNPILCEVSLRKDFYCFKFLDFKDLGGLFDKKRI